MKDKYLLIIFLVFLVAVIYFVTTKNSTEKKGGLEKAGERVDEIIDNVKDGDPILHKKGTLEKAGESLDETLDPNKK